MAAQHSPPRSFSNFRENAENNNPSSPLRSLPTTPASAKDRNARGRSYLEELNVGAVNNAQNIGSSIHNTNSIYSIHSSNRKRNSAFDSANQADTSTASIDSLAEDLSGFHIYSPGTAGDDSVTNKVAGQASRSSLSRPHLQKRGSSTRNKHAHFALPDSPSAGSNRKPGSGLTGPVKRESFSELLSESDIQHTIEKHNAKKFDYILSLPCDAGNLVQSRQLRRICSDASIKDTARDNRKVYFGCNILRQRPRSKSSTSKGSDHNNDSYTLIATPLHPSTPHTSTINDTNMLDALAPPAAASSFGSAELPIASQHMVSPKSFRASLGSVRSDRAQSVSRSPSGSVARIEDTIEELDKLEDKFEEVHRMVRVKRVPSPDKEVRAVTFAKEQVGSTKAPAAKPATLRAATQPSLTHMPSTRRLVPATSSSAHTPTPQSGAAGPTRAPSSSRVSVTRPLSLLPPKLPVKSAKPPTKPAFELPGEAVARRLKEQREARLLAATSAPPNTPKTVAASSGPQLRRVRSMKPPTVADFELPGEAISRRKREEHEAKIRQQEEDERKRREFKAKPIRLSLTPSTVPRETVASRARQSRVSIIGESALTGGGLNVPGSSSSSTKRHSLTAGDTASRATGLNQISRGRGAVLGASPSAAGGTSRAASTSMRSSISVEDVQHQKLRGKEIFQRDNTLSTDRDRERREREATAKQARQEAARRSRVLSHEWAEKQKLKTKKSFITQ